MGLEACFQKTPREARDWRTRFSGPWRPETDSQSVRSSDKSSSVLLGGISSGFECQQRESGESGWREEITEPSKSFLMAKTGGWKERNLQKRASLFLVSLKERERERNLRSNRWELRRKEGRCNGQIFV